MENELNNNDNDKKINFEKNIYSMFEELSEKYKKLEEKQKLNYEKIEKNEKTIFNLNQNLKLIKKYIFDIKMKIEKEINELKEKIKRQNNENKYDEINNLIISNEQLNNIKFQFDEKNNIINKRLEELINDVNEIKISQMSKDNEIKINENILLVNDFKSFLKDIMNKGNLDESKNERLKELIEKLINNSNSPKEYLTNFITENFNKYSERSNKINNENMEKMEDIFKKISDFIDKIEKELKKNNKSKNIEIKEKDNKIEQFRLKFNIKEEEFNDEIIKNHLNYYNGKEDKAYQALKGKK